MVELYTCILENKLDNVMLHTITVIQWKLPHVPISIGLWTPGPGQFEQYEQFIYMLTCEGMAIRYVSSFVHEVHSLSPPPPPPPQKKKNNTISLPQPLYISSTYFQENDETGNVIYGIVYSEMSSKFIFVRIESMCVSFCIIISQDRIYSFLCFALQ